MFYGATHPPGKGEAEADRCPVDFKIHMKLPALEIIGHQQSNTWPDTDIFQTEARMGIPVFDIHLRG